MPDLRAYAIWQQLHDSGLPAGRLVHSNGFEEWLACRPEATCVDIETALVDYLRHSFGTLDATMTAAAWRAASSTPTLVDLDELLSSYKLSAHARGASISAGTQLAGTLCDIGLIGENAYLAAVLAGHAPGNLAVVEGAVQGHIGVDVRTAVLGSARSTLASMVSAAVRLGRLGTLTAQRIQVCHVDTIVELTNQACVRPLDELSSTAVQFDIAGMRHETKRQRLFAS